MHDNCANVGPLVGVVPDVRATHLERGLVLAKDFDRILKEEDDDDYHNNQN